MPAGSEAGYKSIQDGAPAIAGRRSCFHALRTGIVQELPVTTMIAEIQREFLQ